MKTINLLPKDEQKELILERYARQIRLFFIWAMASLIIFLVLSLLSEVAIRQSIVASDSKITQLQKELKSATNQKLQDEVLALNTQMRIIKNLQAQHYRWSEALVEVANVIPSDMQVDFLTLDRATGKVEISGKAGTRTSVLEFWGQVKRSKYFKDIDFPLSNLEKSNGGGFMFTFYVKPEELKN